MLQMLTDVPMPSCADVVSYGELVGGKIIFTSKNLLSFPLPLFLTLPCEVTLHKVTLHKVTLYKFTLHKVTLYKVALYKVTLYKVTV